MIRLITASLAIFLVGVFQTGASSWLAIWLAPPDLPLLLTISLGLTCGPVAGMLAGFGSALVQAGLSQSYLLAHALGLIVSGFVAGELSRRFFREHWLVPVASVLILTLMSELLFWLAAPASSGLSPRWLAIRLLYNTALAWPCFRLTARAREALPARAL